MFCNFFSTAFGIGALYLVPLITGFLMKMERGVILLLFYFLLVMQKRSLNLYVFFHQYSSVS